MHRKASVTSFTPPRQPVTTLSGNDGSSRSAGCSYRRGLGMFRYVYCFACFSMQSSSDTYGVRNQHVRQFCMLEGQKTQIILELMVFLVSDHQHEGTLIGLRTYLKDYYCQMVPRNSHENKYQIKMIGHA